MSIEQDLIRIKAELERLRANLTILPGLTRIHHDLQVDGNLITSPVTCRVRRTTAQTIANSIWTAISFSEQAWDDPAGNDMWVTGSPTRLTVKAPGVYLITAHASLPNTGGGYRRYVAIRLNGATYIAQVSFPVMAGNLPQVIFHASTTWKAAANDYFEMVVFQDSGGNMDTIADSVHYVHSNLAITKIG